MSQAPDPCPLCGHRNAVAFASDAHRHYFRCTTCQLVFVPKAQWPTTEQERTEYELHHNTPDDPGYRRFLNKLAAPLLARLGPSSHGLDFGCGPGPTLSVMLEEAGHSVRLYDPFFAPDQSVFHAQYDFITASEVFEHLQRPARELTALRQLLHPGGILAIMTQTVRSPEAFVHWRYKDDRTHIIFFSAQTFSWIAQQYAFELESPASCVFLLRATSSRSGRHCRG